MLAQVDRFAPMVRRVPRPPHPPGRELEADGDVHRRLVPRAGRAAEEEGQGVQNIQMGSPEEKVAEVVPCALA